MMQKTAAPAALGLLTGEVRASTNKATPASQDTELKQKLLWAKEGLQFEVYPVLALHLKALGSFMSLWVSD